MREIEVKLKANNLAAVKQKLVEAGCVLSEPISQHDVIYSEKGNTAAWEVATTGDVVMRIRRQAGKEPEFNLKQQLTSEHDNIEVETKVSDPEAIDKILSLIGYEPQVEVKKVRLKGKHKGYEICLDEVEGLGSYVELEKLTDENADVGQIREELLTELESLGLSRSDEQTQGYDTQIFKLKHK